MLHNMLCNVHHQVPERDCSTHPLLMRTGLNFSDKNFYLPFICLVYNFQDKTAILSSSMLNYSRKANNKGYI